MYERTLLLDILEHNERMIIMGRSEIYDQSLKGRYVQVMGFEMMGLREQGGDIERLRICYLRMDVRR